MKFKKSALLVCALSGLVAAPVLTAVVNHSTVYAQTQVQPMLSLGASLNVQQADQTKALLGANSVALAKTIYVDGPTINRYLNDGSNINTAVYSSALIQPLPAGSGVQVQVVTPQNILLVKPTTYQNAAITSGAKDVLIKIATVTPVTGEGALTGVYALLEQAGIKVDKQAIVVAEKEIKIVEDAKKSTDITDNQINKLIAEIKTEVTNLVSSGNAVDGNEVVKKVLANNPTIKLPASTFEVLKQLALDYARTEVAKHTDTIKQIQKSIDVSENHPYAVDLSQYGDRVGFVAKSGSGYPSDIVVSLSEGKISYERGTAVGHFTAENISTRAIDVLNPDGTTRQVNVNTILHVPVSGLGDLSGDIFVFVNRDNQLALATPDYSGSTAVYLEYVVGELPVQAAPVESSETVAPVAPAETTETPAVPAETTEMPVTSETNEPVATTEVVDAPYAVDMDLVHDQGFFKREGMNIPEEIEYYKGISTLIMNNYYGGHFEGKAELHTIPTKEIRVFSHETNEIRTVSVNTMLEITPTDGGVERMMFYLFVNRDNKVSLATPNFAGNVEPDQTDVMLEYVQED
ncbi:MULTISPECIES: DUF1002 domain-containing protein [unclassified Facklamia]|uniref:DUF1002 domain-containing protein n=1 Tax=Aerococcaceae TaxID=186827 RepID=UPI0013BC6934|nr:MULTISPECIES: DUF1002 domain-containing protein [unclassified Facklamia]MBS4462482.1 DUF1002 domain-containing protein [Aerococcaceae bacterium zg-B36]NEW65070.1 DUF1002 domain-containing protein [Facklamia sp. 252]NEW68727.1 DUF1002 domain-containing protein [Facklamia sp. 253]QQD65134.1 DUF1002 domain-containing protein [Aerococcaceae bacterium zg-252]